MSGEKSEQSPLLMDGKSPLDVMIERLALKQKEFCHEIGIDTSTYRRWRQGKPASLSVAQAKAIDLKLREIGLSIQDLPDDLSRYQSKSA
jgi:transcriptional regulator with XRE-family HTH domain